MFQARLIGVSSIHRSPLLPFSLTLAYFVLSFHIIVEIEVDLRFHSAKKIFLKARLMHTYIYGTNRFEAGCARYRRGGATDEESAETRAWVRCRCLDHQARRSGRSGKSEDIASGKSVKG